MCWPLRLDHALNRDLRCSVPWEGNFINVCLIVSSSTSKSNPFRVPSHRSWMPRCVTSYKSHLSARLPLLSVIFLQPLNAYGEMKPQAEQLVLAANGARLADGGTLATCAVRPTQVFGEGCDDVAYSESPITGSTFNLVWTWQLWCMESRVPGQRITVITTV